MKSIIICYIITISYLFAHCQVPCGIYDDARKIIEIEEDIMTIKKAMNNIQLISSQNIPSSQEMNQLVRWVTTKEEHAQHIQNTIMEYFLSQRIKPKNSNDDNYLKYVNETIKTQFTIVHNETNLSSTSMYGEIGEDNLLINNFMSSTKKKFKLNSKTINIPKYNTSSNTRYIIINTLTNIYNSKKTKNKDIYKILINQEFERMTKVDKFFNKFQKTINNYQKKKSNKKLDYNCLRKLYSYVDKNCIKFYDYSLKYVDTLVNSCINYGYELSIYIIKNLNNLKLLNQKILLIL